MLLDPVLKLLLNVCLFGCLIRLNRLDPVLELLLHACLFGCLIDCSCCTLSSHLVSLAFPPPFCPAYSLLPLFLLTFLCSLCFSLALSLSLSLSPSLPPRYLSLFLNHPLFPPRSLPTAARHTFNAAASACAVGLQPELALQIVEEAGHGSLYMAAVFYRVVRT